MAGALTDRFPFPLRAAASWVCFTFTPGQRSSLRARRRFAYNVWIDATWGTEEDRISFQGMVVIRYGGAVNWHAQWQRATTLSSMEAEIMAASEGAKEMAWRISLRPYRREHPLQERPLYTYPLLRQSRWTGLDERL